MDPQLSRSITFAECPEPYFGRGGEAPIRLTLAAAACRQAGHAVALEDGGIHADLPSWIAAVRASKPDIVFIHGDTKHLSLAARLADATAARRADATAARRADATAESRPAFRILWGNHSDSLDERTLREFPSIDAVLRHDPEVTLVRVAERLASSSGIPDLSGIAGMTWRRRGDDGSEEIVREKDAPRVDLDAIAPAARDLVRAESYEDFRGPVLGQIFTARGCAYQCSFCEEAGTSLQRRSPARVVDEMLEIRERWGITRFTIRDPLFGPRRHLIAVCKEIQSRMPGISFYCLTHPNQVDPETADALKAAGAWCVDMGVESGDPEVLASYGKGSTIESVQRAVSLLKQRGIAVQLNLVLGGPKDTPATIRRSVDFFLGLEPDYHCVTLLQPVPGSPLYVELEAAGRLRKPQAWDDYFTNPFYSLRDGQVDWRTPPRFDRMIGLSTEVVEELQRAYATLGRRMLGVRAKAAARSVFTGRAFARPGGISKLVRDARRAAQFVLR